MHLGVLDNLAHKRKVIYRISLESVVSELDLNLHQRQAELPDLQTSVQ